MKIMPKIMPKLSATFRIALSLVGISTSLLFVAAVFNFFPDDRAGAMSGRTRLCESMAISFSTMARYTDVGTMKTCFATVAARNPDILSIGLRRFEGGLLFAVGDHEEHWTLQADQESTETQMAVPVYGKKKQWGTVEVRFRPIATPGLIGVLLRPEFALAGFMALASLVTYYVYLRIVLRQLNPSKVIPGRVRDAFDSLAEGIVVLDQQEQVVLVNRAFEQATGKSSKQLLGRSVSRIGFVNRGETTSDLYPWQETVTHSRLIKGRLLALAEGEFQDKTFSVSSAPIIDETGNTRGAMASFEDVSQLEKKKDELRHMVDSLSLSSEHIKKQNRELAVLATRDPLTGCFNRRSFLDLFESSWNAAKRYGHPLSAIMVDIDHFKSVNDDHGHSVGDEVLRRVAETLQETSRKSDIVCRFGGEEFVVLLPHTDIDDGEIAAEKLRAAIAGLKFSQLSTTASFGISALSEQPKDPQDLLDQADKCLYVAKRNGRDQVVRFDQVPEGLEVDKSQISRTTECEPIAEPTSIPFHAVTALISALAYRDQETAAHSRRVADLCVSTAEGLLSLKDCYTLEIAALLHDIGKIGVPDSILLKPSPLSESEWIVMRNHDRIGVEIIRASFASTELSEIVENHHAHFGENASKPETINGRDIPVGARILSIVDAYDAIVCDRVYRKGRSRTEAFSELRRCAGTQFDPELVERFIRTVRISGEEETLQTDRVSPETALSIGIQLERIVSVLDNQDPEEIRVLSQRLTATATKCGALEIASKASELGAVLESDGDLLNVMQSANELLDLCRSTQHSFLQPTEA